MIYLSTAVALLISGAALIVFGRYGLSSRRLPYPPGPPDLQAFPATFKWVIFDEWRRKYGPVTFLRAAGRPYLILNTQEAAVDLLEKRSTIYSDRPGWIMARWLCGLQWIIGTMPYGPTLTKHRKLIATPLHPLSVQRDFVPLQEHFGRRLVKSLIEAPENFDRLIPLALGQVSQTIAYGTYHEDGLDLLALAEEGVRPILHKTALFSGYGYAVEALPWLRRIPDWFPGAQFKRDAKEWKRTADAMLWLPFSMVKRKMIAGQVQRKSMVSSLLEANDVAGGGREEEEIIAGAAANMYFAATHTTGHTVMNFLLAMTLYPDIQARAQKEIDMAIGDRLPTVADQEKLPFITAILIETLRWHPVNPNGGPRKILRDDIYNGYLIPAGTIVMPDVWGIMHDEQYFPDPLAFNPDRWCPSSENTANPPIDPFTVVFGYGRRFCPGIHIVRSGVWIIMATILASLEIRHKIDPNTKQPVAPNPKWTGRDVNALERFECDIKPRSRESAERIREALLDDNAHGFDN